mmetsp:Transcript_16323/g.32991  ORF Transcript_16323/g.32991 Transcript_16323/m.32991 type:complete len:104 (-) Transcript_16323:227-538(-)
MRKSMAPTTLRNNETTWIDDITTSDLLDGCTVMDVDDAARSSYDESVIIRAMQQSQCMGSREIDSNLLKYNSSKTLLLSLNSILGFCSALKLVDVVSLTIKTR